MRLASSVGKGKEGREFSNEDRSLVTGNSTLFSPSSSSPSCSNHTARYTVRI